MAHDLIVFKHHLANNSWNDSALGPGQLCLQPTSTGPQPISVYPWDLHFK